jgi:hypothetical protein
LISLKVKKGVHPNGIQMGLKVAIATSMKEADGIRKAFEAGLEPSSLSLILDRIIVSLLQNSPLAKVEFIKC